MKPANSGKSAIVFRQYAVYYAATAPHSSAQNRCGDPDAVAVATFCCRFSCASRRALPCCKSAAIPPNGVSVPSVPSPFSSLARYLPRRLLLSIKLVVAATVASDAMDIDELKSPAVYFGTTTGQLWLGRDGGDEWECLFDSLPPINCVKVAVV